MFAFGFKSRSLPAVSRSSLIWRVSAALLFSVFWAMFSLQGFAIETEYVILVTADGLRHQELFGGMAPMFSQPDERAGIQDLDALREEFWDEDQTRRREKLLPFFWRRLAGEGMVFGNPEKGSLARVKNSHRFSYPGYAEILNGAPQPSVTSNDPVFSPRTTVLEFLRSALSLQPQAVATFASWEVFNWITMSEDGAVYCNAGIEPIATENLTADAKKVVELQSKVLPPWNSVRHDGFTIELALNHLRTERPRFLYLALDETDDWAHDRRYDRYLKAARLFDGSLERLWEFVQSDEQYRGKTSLIITSDHGRGRTPDDWTDHGAEMDETSEIWIAVVGPDTPNLGELTDQPTVYQSQIAATILRFYGLDPVEFNPAADAAISGVLVR